MGNEILIGGHSHVNALVGDRHVNAPAVRCLEGEPDVSVLDGPWPRSEAYFERLAAESAHRRVGLVWGGNEHNSVYFFQAAYRFDFASRYVSRILGRAQIVTQRAVRQRFRKLSLDDMGVALKSIRAAGPEKLALVGTPPPKKDNEKLRAVLEREPVFLAWADQLRTSAQTIEITDPHVRLKLWYLLQDMFREAAQAHGAAFISTPAEVQDEEGFLKEEYWAPDVTHANADYGRVVLAKVLEELRH